MVQGGEMEKKLQDFKIRVETKGSSEFLTAGDASVCCMGCGSQRTDVAARSEICSAGELLSRPCFIPEGCGEY